MLANVSLGKIYDKVIDIFQSILLSWRLNRHLSTCPINKSKSYKHRQQSHGQQGQIKGHRTYIDSWINTFFQQMTPPFLKRILSYLITKDIASVTKKVPSIKAIPIIIKVLNWPIISGWRDADLKRLLISIPSAIETPIQARQSPKYVKFMMTSPLYFKIYFLSLLLKYQIVNLLPPL